MANTTREFHEQRVIEIELALGELVKDGQKPKHFTYPLPLLAYILGFTTVYEEVKKFPVDVPKNITNGRLLASEENRLSRNISYLNEGITLPRVEEFLRTIANIVLQSLSTLNTPATDLTMLARKTFYTDINTQMPFEPESAILLLSHLGSLQEYRNFLQKLFEYEGAKLAQKSTAQA